MRATVIAAILMACAGARAASPEPGLLFYLSSDHEKPQSLDFIFAPRVMTILTLATPAKFNAKGAAIVIDPDRK
ncbi:MAG TPA: hypothetical protein VHD56_13050 [Tepidisphaeraceae bacterium]|nr:hypothetical protein [Tepidisphaeraceae bacterium]